MRIPSNPVDAIILSSLLFPLLAGAQTIDCTHVRVKNVPFDLSKLGGPRSVLHSVDHGNGASFTNTTYTIDICAPLRPAKEGKKEERCPVNTRICAIERFIKLDPPLDVIQDAFPVAGDLLEQGGKAMDAHWKLLKESESHEDSQKDGLLLEMKGGFNMVNEKKKAQKAIVEFLCDKSREGTELLYDPEDKYEQPKGGKERREEDKKEGDKDDDKKGTHRCADGAPSLQFLRYDQSDAEVDVLRLRWYTKYACEGAKDEQDPVKSAHWGFFTWFILIAFLSTAAYLIFGSWLNYNRYGARGWDLVPHGDAIRDVPYMMKDWTRKVMNSVQGGGSRGGYAAV